MSGDPSEVFTFTTDLEDTVVRDREAEVQTLAQELRKLFFDAARITMDDETVSHSDGNLYAKEGLDIIDTTGGGMPPQFWVHYARLMLS